MASEISAELMLEIKGFLDGIKKSQDAANRFGKSGKGAANSFGKSFGGIAKVIGGVAKAALKAAALIGAAFAAIGGAIGAKFLKGAMTSAADFEQLSISMATFTKDADIAKGILDQISEFSVSTPFETKGLQDATNKLLSAGIAADDVVDVLKETAAVSKDTGQVGELADALSKGFAKGKFQTEELNKFLERGINLMPALANVTGKSGEALQKAIQKGLKFDDVRAAIASMSAEGGLFYGMLEKQSKTTTGLVSTLKSNVEEFQRQFGQPLNDALKPILESAIKFSQKLTANASEWGTKFAETLATIGAAIRAAVQVFSSMPAAEIAGLFGAALRLGIGNAINFLSKAGAATFSALIAYFFEGIKNSIALMQIMATSDFWAGMLNALLGIAAMLADALLKHLSNYVAAANNASEKLTGKRILGGAEDKISDAREGLAEEAQRRFDEAGVDLAPAFEKVGERMRATGAAMGAAFQKTFKESTDLVDVSGEEAALNAVAAQIAATAAELKGNKPKNAAAGGGGEGALPVIDDRQPDSGLPKLNSKLAGAINTISGRSANAVIAAEAAKTSQNTERTAKAAEQIAKNTAGNGKPNPKPKPQSTGAGKFG